jgi:hypothetical protein
MTDSTSTATVSLHSPTLTVDIAARVLDTHPQRLEEKDSNGRTPLLVACFGTTCDVSYQQRGRCDCQGQVRSHCAHILCHVCSDQYLRVVGRQRRRLVLEE